MPYYIKLSTGCEIYSNDRMLRVIISEIRIGNELRYNVTYYVRADKNWEKGSEGRYIDNLDRYKSELCNSPSFSKATEEMKNMQSIKNV